MYKSSNGTNTSNVEAETSPNVYAKGVGVTHRYGRPVSFNSVPTDTYIKTERILSREEFFYHLNRHRGYIVLAFQPTNFVSDSLSALTPIESVEYQTPQDLLINNPSRYITITVKRENVKNLIADYPHDYYYCFVGSNGVMYIEVYKKLDIFKKAYHSVEALGATDNPAAGATKHTEVDPSNVIVLQDQKALSNELEAAPLLRRAPLSPEAEQNTTQQEAAPAPHYNPCDPKNWDPTDIAMPQLTDEQFDQLSDSDQELYSELLHKWNMKFHPES